MVQNTNDQFTNLRTILSTHTLMKQRLYRNPEMQPKYPTCTCNTTIYGQECSLLVVCAMDRIVIELAIPRIIIQSMPIVSPPGRKLAIPCVERIAVARLIRISSGIAPIYCLAMLPPSFPVLFELRPSGVSKLSAPIALILALLGGILLPL